MALCVPVDGWIKKLWLPKRAKANNVPSFLGQDIRVSVPMAFMGKPVGGWAGRYYVLDNVLLIFAPDKAAQARMFLDCRPSDPVAEEDEEPG